jgi:hypothetical protein
VTVRIAIVLCQSNLTALILDFFARIWLRYETQLLQRRQRSLLAYFLYNLPILQREDRRAGEVHLLASVHVVEMISELPDLLSTWEKTV